MAESRFLYVTYIRATPERIFETFLDPEQTPRFWKGFHQRSSWKAGDDYAIVDSAGKTWDRGKVLACEPPKRLQVSWNHLVHVDMAAEGESIATFELEPVNEAVTKVTLTHTIQVAPSKLIEGVSGGWPSILASLKSLLETGEALEAA
jgi:uncharacterized protein YndB with AHSA1/START domain